MAARGRCGFAEPFNIPVRHLFPYRPRSESIKPASLRCHSFLLLLSLALARDTVTFLTDLKSAPGGSTTIHSALHHGNHVTMLRSAETVDISRWFDIEHHARLHAILGCGMKAEVGIVVTNGKSRLKAGCG